MGDAEADTTQGYRALDFPFRVQADNPLRAWLLDALVPFAVAERSGPLIQVRERNGAWSVSVDGDLAVHDARASQVVHRLMVLLNHRIANSRRHLVLHGAVLADESGTIVAAGPSGSGKSTLTAVALQNGFRYGGDEHAALGLDDGLIYPVPKPIGLKFGSAERFRTFAEEPTRSTYFSTTLYLTPSQLDAEVLHRPSAPRLFVLPRFEAGAKVSIDRLRPAAGMMRLRTNAFNFLQSPIASFTVLAAAVRSHVVLELTYGDAESALEALHDYAP